MTHNALRLTLSAVLALLPVAHGAALAQAATPGEQVTFELRPHCVESDHAAADDAFGGEVPEIDGITTLTQGTQTPCPPFPVRDPLSKQTEPLKVGDTLDMDLVLHNPKAMPITRYRAWILYDSTVLEGVTFELSDAFPVPTPGEADFSIADNYIKASATSAQPVSSTKIVLARITLKVLTAPANGVILAFHNPSGTETAHTGAFVTEGGQEANVAANVQGSLVVRFAGTGSSAASVAPVASSVPAATGSVSSVASVPASSTASSVASAISSAPTFFPSSSSLSSSSSSSVAAVPTVFTKLQVQALRVTTEGSSAFLAWNPLPSAELAGYNLYYGSISGRYLQRRSVDKDAQTITIRALPVGQTYYFAVRAVNASGAESDYSQEVAVTIGNPATSTSPLSGNLIEGPQGNAPGTGGNVAGESGPASWIALLLGISAVLGTAFAFRRQMTASSALTR